MTFARPARETREARLDRIANQRPPMTLHTATMGGGVRQIAAKPKKRRQSDNTRDAQIHKGKLATLGCMVCLRMHGAHSPGAVELHHLRTGGWGKGGYLTLIPLCVEHHRGVTGVHGLGTKRFAKHYGFDQADLLADALRLAEKGLL